MLSILAFSGMDIVTQTIIALIVVAIYHLWLHRKTIEAPQKAPAPPPPPLAAPRPAQPTQPTAPAPKVVTAIPPEIAAVIAAAVAVLFETPLKVLSVQPAEPSVSHLNVWAMEGRMEIFASHRLR